MKKILSLLVLLACVLLYYLGQKSPYPPPLSRGSFDKSLGVDTFGKDFVFEKALDKEMGDLAHHLIEKRRQEWNKNAKNIIPLAIHHVWTGEGTMEDRLARGVQSVKIFHKDVPTFLWTRKEYEPLLETTLGPVWSDLPKELLPHVVSAVILLQYGGVVVDPAAECVQSIKPLLSFGDCILGFEPPSSRSHFKRRLLLSPGVIASTPAHPLIQAWLREMVRRAASKGAMRPKKFYRWVVKDALTSVVASQALESGRVLLVGPTYFCPIAPRNFNTFQEMVDGSLHRSTLKKVLQTLHIMPSLPYSDVTHETMFIHVHENNQKKGLETKKEAC